MLSQKNFVIVCVCALFVSSFPSRGFAEEQSTLPATLGPIKPAQDVDERLFLVRLLDMHYAAWPQDSIDPDSFTLEMAELRKSAIRLREYIAGHQLGEDLERLYTDFISCIEAYTHFLVRIGAIQEDVAVAMFEDHFVSGFNAGFAGASVYSGMSRTPDVSSGEAVASAILAYGISYAVDAYMKGQERDRAEQEAINKALRKLDDQFQAILARSNRIKNNLAKEYGWKKGEAGIQLSEHQSNAIMRLYEEGDVEGLYGVTEKQAKQRPRDPFIRSEHILYRAMLHEDSKSVLLDCAREQYKMANLVPADIIYDDYRLEYVYMAAVYALEARLVEVMKGGSPYGSTETSKYCVLYSRKLMELLPDDPMGYGRYLLASSLLADGQVAASVAIARELKGILSEEPEYHYLLACLNSRQGHAEEALRWLKRSIIGGIWDIEHVKADPDLAFLQEHHSSQFNEIVAVRALWGISMDWIYDDITLKNYSLFPLTNVTLNVHLVQDDKVWNRSLQVEVLMPGEEHVWDDAVSVPGGRLTSKNAVLICDQKPE